MTPFWIATCGPDLAQSDLLPGCQLPLVPDTFRPSTDATPLTFEVGRLVVMTQSCDLVNTKNGLAALCAIYTLTEFETVNPAMAKKGMWEEVRKGRREGLHLLASPTMPGVSREALVVNFREIFSLPVGYLRNHATPRHSASGGGCSRRIWNTSRRRSPGSSCGSGCRPPSRRSWTDSCQHPLHDAAAVGDRHRAVGLVGHGRVRIDSHQVVDRRGQVAG